jgi:putative hemolysin
MHGRRGLYTSTLFEYPTAFLDRIQPAIELGRSFVRPEYQKYYHPLMLLWKGIGRFVTLNPQYKTLIGPVSISNNYLSISRELIAAFYRKSSDRRGSADMVKSNNPLRYKLKSRRNLKAACTLLHDIQDVSEVISDIETDQKGIPILFKHYMKLGGDILGLTIDHNFSDVMDVLILVDLTRTDPRILERYMGKEEAVAFLRYHGGGSLAHCA